MKVKFSRSITFVPEWNGNKDLPETQQVKVVMKALEMDDLMKLIDQLQHVNQDDSNSKLKELLGTCGNLIPKYCEVLNLQDDTGEVTADLLVKYPWYLPLSVELLQELASISMPNEVEEKNSKEQPDLLATLQQ